MREETAGDPMTGLKWSKKATEKISAELKGTGVIVGAKTVGRLLVKMGFTLRTCRKNIEAGRKYKPGHRERRDAQFKKIKTFRSKFKRMGAPVISIDCKKKEKVGNFRNEGTTWRRKAKDVFDHDFPSDAKGKAIPYGIYDIQRNKALVVVGTSSETPEFAIDTIEKWWLLVGRSEYKSSKHLLVLADCGGGNGYRSTIWKRDAQTKLCNRYGLTVRVCHYPPGASKWNPIEHRVFSEISKNWRGVPLETYETVLNYIGTTTTETGLEVKSVLNQNTYSTGKKATRSELANLNILKDSSLPEWNYTIRPHKNIGWSM